MFWATAVAEVSGQLGKSLLKFCSGELGPEGVLPDTQLLDLLLKEASTEPPAQPPDKGMDGEAPPPGKGWMVRLRPLTREWMLRLGWDAPLLLPVPTLSPHPAPPVLGPQRVRLLQIASSTSIRRGPQGCPRPPL